MVPDKALNIGLGEFESVIGHIFLRSFESEDGGFQALCQPSQLGKSEFVRISRKAERCDVRVEGLVFTGKLQQARASCPLRKWSER